MIKECITFLNGGEGDPAAGRTAGVRLWPVAQLPDVIANPGTVTF